MTATSVNQNMTGVAFTRVEAAPSFAVGTIVRGNDGHDYIYARATGAIADDATAVLSEPAMTVAAGAGSWTNRTGVALAANDHAWIQKTAA